MAITTIDIDGFYTVPGNPSLKLQARIYKPSTPGPYAVVVATQAPHFTGDGTWGPAVQCINTLVEAGYLCLGFGVRSLEPLPNQITPGTWDEQTDDCHAAILYMRPGHEIETVHGIEVINYVGILGGSGSAGHAAYVVADGTQGLDKADCAICMSPATDFSDRDDVSQPFITKCAEYADLDPSDLVNLLARSPIARDLANANDTIHYNGTSESMPLTNLTRYRDARLAAGGKGAGNYEWHINNDDPIDKSFHAFRMWTNVKENVLNFVAASVAKFNGTEPPPPPDETGRVKVTALISNLAPGQALTLNVAAHDNVTGLDGPATGFDFISDRADTGGQGKAAPVGVYAIVDATEGIINGNIATRAWLNFDYVDGGILPTSWVALNGASRSSFNWTQIDAFLAALASNDKLGGISVSMGIKSPLWIYSGQHSVNGFFVNGPNSGTIPIPWDPNWLQVVKRFIIEFATRYDTHTSLSYITVGGMGQLLDTLLVQNASNYNGMNANAVAAGFPDLITAWAQTSAGILDIWTKAFRTTAVYMAINLPVPSINGGLTGIDEFTRASIDRYRSRLGVMTLELDGLTAAGPDLSLNKIIHDANRSPRAYRFLRPSSDPACDPSQDPESYDPELGLRTAANAGITIGVQMEEFYESDILTVTGDYPDDFTDFQTDLTANA